jgi:hypothetical protein
MTVKGGSFFGLLDFIVTLVISGYINSDTAIKNPVLLNFLIFRNSKLFLYSSEAPKRWYVQSFRASFVYCLNLTYALPDFIGTKFDYSIRFAELALRTHWIAPISSQSNRAHRMVYVTAWLETLMRLNVFRRFRHSSHTQFGSD